MTSLKQLEANRRNALKSTGPRTENGKHASRRNALRHGFTAETVIEPLEDPEEYRRFETAIVAEYLPQTPAERELVHRLASLFWRLRRATSIETGLLRMQSEIVHWFRNSRPSTIRAREGEVPFAHPIKPVPNVAEMVLPSANVRRSLTPRGVEPTRQPHRGTSRLASCAWPISTARSWTGSAAARRRSGDSSPRPSLRSKH